MRLIDADAEAERLKKDYCEKCKRKGNYGIFGAACTPCWVMDAVEEFENAPTVKAEPVRHGQWETWGYVFHGIEWKRCSRCGKCADVSYYGILDGEIKMSTPAICGGCGAKMDGSAEHVAD